MRTASKPALRALPTPTVATGTPLGIWTIDSSESMPSSTFNGIGTPMTGNGDTAARTPGRCAAPPAPAMITPIPRSAADRPYASVSSGIRCADETSASKPTSNSLHASAAACMIGQSESDPMTIPTRASDIPPPGQLVPSQAPANHSRSEPPDTDRPGHGTPRVAWAAPAAELPYPPARTRDGSPVALTPTLREPAYRLQPRAREF